MAVNGTSHDHFAYALSSNGAWSSYKTHQNPSFFPKMAEGQSPKILWLGCSDSRVPETTLLGLQPGDVFVHRNIANIVSPTDISVSAVLEFAVGFLKVQHIILCGHTSCGGAAAVLAGGQVGGVLDTWLTPLKAVKAANEKELKGIKDEKARPVRLAELNVEAGTKVLMAHWVVQDAMRKKGLKVHGVLYDIGCGKLRDLECGNENMSFGTGLWDNESKETLRGSHAILKFKGDGAEMAAVKK